MYVFSDSYHQLREILGDITALLARLGLTPNARKTTLLEREHGGEGVFVASGGLEIAGPGIERRETTAQLVADLLARGGEASRSEVVEVCRRILYERSKELAAMLLARAGEFPHGADRIARVVRELGLSSNAIPWIIEYARAHLSPADWSVAAWATVVTHQSRSSVLVDFFEKVVRFGTGPQALLPIACFWLARWKVDGVKELLEARIEAATHAWELRTLVSARAMLGALQPELRSELGLSDRLIATQVVSGRWRPTWEFRDTAAPSPRVVVRLVRSHS